MSHTERIHELLDRTKKQFCDDCISAKLHMKARQQARARCIELVEQGVVVRGRWLTCDACGKTKFCTKIGSGGKAIVAPTKKISTVSRPWFWEGHIQGVLVGWLQGSGWTIRQAADTAAKTPGKDIIAQQANRLLWVTVKGYPEGTAKTNAATQARHWFSHAVFDLVCYRTESAESELAIGVPDCGVTYGHLAERTRWALTRLPALILWVNEHGSVREQRFE